MTYRRKDTHYRRARAEGYRARSAYKLTELDRRYRLMRPGDRVVDLGAWPGGWLQVVAERIGPAGRVVGVDIAEIAPLARPNVVLVTGDVRDAATILTVRERLGAAADVLLSDLAPKLTGIRATDEARSTELAATVLDALPVLLRQGGRMLMKVFSGPSHDEAIRRARAAFREVRATRPEASRQGSSELYLIALDHQPAADA
jgi:23S rRNA (uridine2552-2'-O)-methyltransferase